MLAHPHVSEDSSKPLLENDLETANQSENPSLLLRVLSEYVGRRAAVEQKLAKR